MHHTFGFNLWTMLLSGVAFFAILIIIWIFALIDCISSKMDTSQKLLWLFVIFVFNIFGAVLYLIFARLPRGKTMNEKKIKGKKLFRSRDNIMIAGVCGGLGEYFEVDPTLIRLIWVIFTIFGFGTGILAYILAWIIIPEKKR